MIDKCHETICKIRFLFKKRKYFLKEKYELLCFNFRSVNVFMLDTMKFYGEAIAKQENLPQIDVQEDVIQLGGDFTIEKVSKKMVFLYPSKTSADRPTLEMILEAVEK